MFTNMKHEIFLFIFWVFSSGSVVSYPNYQVDYPQEEYYQHPGWANSQRYPNERAPLDPTFPRYVPQHKPHYAHSLPEIKPHQEQESHLLLPGVESVQNQPEVNSSPGKETWNSLASAAYTQASASLPNSYQETSRPYLPERNYNYGSQPSPWPQAPPQEPAYVPESYPPPVQRQWHHPYSQVPPVLVNPQETYQQHVAYPNWQSNVPAKDPYYNNPQDGQNIYNTPIKYPAHAEAQAQASSDNNFHDRVPKQKIVKDTPSDKQVYLLVYPNGTTERVDVQGETVLGSSQHIQTFKNHKVYEDDIKKIPHGENKILGMPKRDNPKHKNENYTGENKESPVVTPVDYTNNTYQYKPHFKTPNNKIPPKNEWNKKHVLPIDSQPQQNNNYGPLENQHLNRTLVENNDSNKIPKKSPAHHSTEDRKSKNSPSTNDKITTESPCNQNPTKKSDEMYLEDETPTTEENHYEAARTGSTQEDETGNKKSGDDGESFNVIEVLNETPNNDDEGKVHKKDITDIKNHHHSPSADEIKTSPSVETQSLDDDTKTGEEGKPKPQSKPLSKHNETDFALNFDFTNLKKSDKKRAWLPAEQFWTELLSPENMVDYDTVIVYNVALTPIIQKNSTVYMYEDGTIKEEIIETSWDHKDDILPRQIKTTTIITYPDREQKPNKTDDKGTATCK